MAVGQNGIDFDKIYPIGSIYMSVNSTNPKDLFGGTWEQLKDRFLLGCGSKANGTTGGEETHTLTINEMPSHDHTGIHIDNVDYFGWDNGTLNGVDFLKMLNSAYWSNSMGNRLRVGYTGGSQAHNNMPPYLTVYMWKRTA